MKQYEYKAKDGATRTVQRTLLADSQRDAVAKVEAMGYIPVWVRESQGDEARTTHLRRRRVRHEDITLFTRQVASLTKSGVPILRALRTIQDQATNRALERVVADLEDRVREGAMLSEAMEAHPRLFSSLYINMIRAGEAGGVLDTILVRLAEARERQEESRRRVQSALAYPVLVLAVGLGTVFVLLTFLLPRITPLFDSYQQLPGPTQVLIGISDFFQYAWHWILIGILLLVAVITRLHDVERGRLVLDAMLLRMPLLGPFLLEYDLAQFGRTLALLLDSGIHIERALTLSGKTMRNAVLDGELAVVRDDALQHGTPISTGLREAATFPNFVANMVGVGEESGRLEEALTELADFYERSTEQRARVMTSLLEPILLLVVGGIVGFIVFAMLLPVFELGSGLG